MKFYTNKIRIFSILILVGSLGVFGFKLYYDHGLQYPKSLSDFNETGDYKIDPQTILLDLDQGKTNIFQPRKETGGESNDSFPSDYFSWKQVDYLRVASALHQFVWKDSVDNWHIYGMQFFRDCQNNPVGLGSAYITYFKNNDQQQGYSVHIIAIYPSGSGVSWGGGDGLPRPLLGWKSIDLDRLKVTAGDALQAAEEIGGREFRMSQKNECEIHSSLKPTLTGNKWIVTYFANSSSDIFEYRIDAYTD